MEYFDENYLNQGDEFYYDPRPFYTDQVFNSHEELTKWAQTTGRSLGYVIIKRRSNKNAAGFVRKVLLTCDRGGVYDSRGNTSTRSTETRKINCPFQLECYFMEYYGWRLNVKEHKHNHLPAEHLEDHSYARRLSVAEKDWLKTVAKLNLPPRDMLANLKKEFPDNVSTIKDIYNALKRIKEKAVEQVECTTPATSSQHVPPIRPSAPDAEPSSPPQIDLDELPIGLNTAKTKERAWIITENQKKKQKTTTQGSVFAGNPQLLERVPPIRFRFPTADALEKYEVCTKSRNLFMERGFTCSKSNQLKLPHTITQVIKAHKWETFCQNPSPASIPLVREFYANYDAARPDLVYVRGKLVDASPSAINSIFSLTNHQSTLFDDVNNLLPRVMSYIVDELTRRKVIVRKYCRPFSRYVLKKGLEIWMCFTKHNLFPYGDNYVGKELAILLYCIVVGKPINVEKVIAKQIRKCASLKSGGLWFPALITRLCEQHNVLPALREPIQQPYSCLPVCFVERTVNYEPVESEHDQQTNLSNQQTSHSDHGPSFPVANTGHQSRVKFGSGPKLPVPAEDTENAPSHFDSYQQSPPPTAQATSSKPLPPLAPPAKLRCLPETDSDKLPAYFQIYVPGLPILAEAAENGPPHFNSSQQSPPATAQATSSQSLPPVAPSVLPAEPLSPPQTDSVVLQVSSPQCGTICVQGYNVKRNVAPILEAIFKKHGDIAAECRFKTASVRSNFLEVVCEVVARIEADDVIEKMEEVEGQVSDAEAANINVSWLRAHLEALYKRKGAMNLVETKANINLVQIAAQMDLKEICEELMTAQTRFERAERCVRVLHLVNKKIENTISETKAETELWVKRRVL